MSLNKEFFANKTVLIMGLGRFGGGVDAAKFAASKGAKVIVTDLAPADKLIDSINQLAQFPDIEYHLGSHQAADFERADIIIVNPAVDPTNEFLDIARQHNKLITSQVNIFFQLCPATIIGITGANGKSTTAALTAHLLKSQTQNSPSAPVWLSGNIGNQPLLTIIDQISPDDLVVLELSSFQLEQLAQIQKAPKLALLTNLTVNHLDRYSTFADYCAAKENIFKFQKLNRSYPAVSIFNADDKIGTEWFEKYKKDKGRICIKFSVNDISDKIKDNFSLPGKANLSNLAGAMAIARYFGIKDEQIKSCLSEFKPLPHRLELIAQINEVQWYNDSKATTPASTIASLQAFDRPVILIAGGYDKGLSFKQLGKEIAENAKAAILIGQTAKKIEQVIKLAQISNFPRKSSKSKHQNLKIEIANSLDQAVQLAGQLAKPGDVVLFSPACASFDMFDNFAQRGQQFCRLVQKDKNSRHKM